MQSIFKYIVRTFFVLFLVQIAFLASAQLRRDDRSGLGGGGGFGNSGGGFGGESKRVDRQAYRKQQDSINAHRIKPLIKLWRLEADGAYKVRHYRDTLNMDRQILLPIYKKSIVNTFTGNSGGAYQTAIFSLRKPVQEFLFLQPYEWYLSRPETHNFIDTRTPYTEINYATGQKKNNQENLFNVLFTRNINKNWNVGLRYNLVSSDGQYQNQKQKVYDFTLFTNFEVGRYKFYGFWSHNRIRGEENGGITEDVFVERDTVLEAQNMAVKLFRAGASFHNSNYFISHQYNIGEMRKRVLFGDTTKVYPIKLVHTLHIDKSEREYHDEESSDEYYKQFSYVIGKQIVEKVEFSSLKNSIQAVLNEGYFNWFKYGLRAELQYEHITYVLPSLQATFPNKFALSSSQYVQNNAAAEFGAFFSSTEKTNWAARWKTYLTGYRAGDMIATAHYTRYLGHDSLRNHKLKLNFEMSNKTPSLLWNQYFSNHIAWENNFSKEALLDIGGFYKNKKWKLEVGGNWQAINNYVYFGEEALPLQHNGKISVLSAYVKKDLHWWKLHFQPTIYWQKSSNENVLPLPMLSAYGNLYFEGDLFSNALRLRIGVDGRYYTKWTAPAYFPATGQFFLQKGKELGGYPKADVYLVARFKRASFFLKYEHINELLGNTNYFSALHYPISPSILKYGIRWYFYD